MSEEVEVSAEVRTELVRRKLEIWRNTYVDAELDAKIAEALEDEGLRSAAMERMKRALKAIQLLEKMNKL